MHPTIRRSATAAIALLVAIVTASGDRWAPAYTLAAASPPQASAVQADRSARPPSNRDLSADEAMGGHTLARHVGKTDAELVERLRREPQISTASTYTDRATAERVVGAALASAGRSFEQWRTRTEIGRAHV